MLTASSACDVWQSEVEVYGRSLLLNFWIESCLVCNHPGSVRIILTKDSNLYRRMPAHPSDISRDGNIQRSYELKPFYWKLLWPPLPSAGQLGASNTRSLSASRSAGALGSCESLCCPEMLYCFRATVYEQFWGCFEITLGWVFFPTLARPHMSAALSSKSSPVTAALDSAAGFKSYHSIISLLWNRLRVIAGDTEMGATCKRVMTITLIPLRVAQSETVWQLSR